MPITRDQATALAELLCTIRPNWNTRGVIVRGLGPLAKHPAPLEVIVWAAVRAALDTEHVQSPAVIPLNGPHWALAERPPVPRLTPDLECPNHVGQWAGNCSSCNADVKAAPDPEPADDLDPITGRQAAIEKAKRRAREAREGTTTTTDTPAPPGTPQHAPCVSCGRNPATDVAAHDCNTPDAHVAPGTLPHHYGHPNHTATHNELRPDRAGTHPDTQRRLAQQEAGAMLTARNTGQLCDTDGCYWPTERHNHPIEETVR